MKINAGRAKKIGLIVSIVFGVLILLSILIPLVVDIDNFRPKITSVVNNNIHGRVEIGHLRLRLLGGVGASIEGIKLYGSKNFGEKEILTVETARIKVSLFSLITRKPNIAIILNSPDLMLVRNKEGVWNVVDVVRKKEEPVAAIPATPESKTKEMPAIIQNSKISIKLNNAKATVNDMLAGKTSTIKDLYLELRDVALDSPMKFRISFDATGDYKNYNIVGVISSEGRLRVKFREKEIDSGFLDAKFNCKGADFEQKGVFKKGEGVP